MDSSRQPPDLGNKISELIRNGIILTDDVVHYIDSTFSRPTVNELAGILSDPENCETETVFELIFYPDRRLQEQLEPALINTCYDEKDVESAISCLSQKKLQVPVTFPDPRGTLSVSVPDSAIRQFVARLKITRTIDRRLAETIARCIPNDSEILRLRVLLRNCRNPFSGPACDFLCTCIEKMYNVSGYFWEALTFLLNFFDYADPKQDIYLNLMQEKRTLIHSIEQAEKNEKALKNSSVEALMLKGVSILSINIEQTRKQIVLIDHICISVFGRTELYGHENHYESPVTVRDFSPDDFY